MTAERVENDSKKADIPDRVIQKVVGDFRVVLGSVTVHNVMQLQALNKAIFPLTYNDKFYLEVLKAGDLAKFAYFNDVVVGAVCSRICDVLEKRSLYIMTLGTLAPYRQFGIGTVLINHIFKLCETDSSVKAVCLHVQVNNSNALNFYKRHGFQIEETVKNYYRLTPSDAYLLVKKVRD